MLRGQDPAPRAEAVPAEIPLGVGIASPALDPTRTLYFYGPPTEGILPSEMTPYDSLTFAHGEHYVDIATAPPWFVPEALKLDYDILLFRVVTLSRDLIEVVVNGTDQRTAWVAREAVGFKSWPAFLLEVFSVEVPEEIDNPVRVKALDYAGLVTETSEPLRPLAVRGDWIEVTSEGLGDGPVVRGWIRWRDGERLTIRYSLLS